MRRTPRLIVLVSAALLALLVAGFGCASGGGTVQKGINCYNAANFHCAAALFQEIEAAGYNLNAKGHVRYLAYRGLTHFHLGQADLARRFLNEANAAYRSGHPNWLPPDAVAQLNQALGQLSGGAAPPPPPGPGPAPMPPEPTNIQ